MTKAKAGVTEMRRKFFALSDVAQTRRFCFMNELTLSVFVDESGNFSYPDEVARFYIITLVLHRQVDSISELIRHFDNRLAQIKLNDLCFHAGPIIRREDGYAYMNWELRNHIFSLMMAFLRKAPVKYTSVTVDKKYVSTLEQLHQQLASGLDTALNAVRDFADDLHSVKVYYDCGQAPITQLLHQATDRIFGATVQFAQGVRPKDYKLFQLADLICTLTLIESKLEAGLPMTLSEEKFFGGARAFKRIYLKQLKAKRL